MPTHESQRGGATGNWRLWSTAWHLPIGLLCALAQPVLGQVRIEVLTEQVGEIAARNSTYQKRFRELLLTVSSRDLHAGWELARNLGRPVAPVLWNMMAAEQANVDQRVVLLIAAVLAGGPSEDARLLALLDVRKPMLQERIIAGLLMALGPHRSRPVPKFWSRCIGPNPEPEPLLGLAARLACARFPDAAIDAPGNHGDDPGMLAAAAFAGMRISAAKQNLLWRSEERHVELFFRGALLGEGWRVGIDGHVPILLEQARELLGRRDERLTAVRAAAILLQARAGVLDARSERPDWRLMQLVASQPSSHRALQAWLAPTPSALDEEPARLAVAYALYQPLEQVLNSLRDWHTTPDVRRDMAVALAFRLAAGSGSSVRDGGQQTPVNPSETPSLFESSTKSSIIKLGLPEVPEFAFVVWASGGQPGVPVKCQDQKLNQLATLLVDGRASRSVVRAALEEALWRWGSHPGIGPWREERLLIRDLLLVGSKRGGWKYQSHIPQEQRYVATGLDRSDPFFSIAVDLYEFLQRPVGPVPSEYRLK